MRTFTIPIGVLGLLGAALIFWAVRSAMQPEPPENSSAPVLAAKKSVVAIVKEKLAAPLFASKKSASTADDALLTATIAQNWGTVRELIANGAKIDAADRLGFTPLMAAAMHGNAELVQTFLDNHAAPETTDLSGRSALDYAIESRHLEAAQLLLPHANNLDAIGGRLVQFAFALDEKEIAHVLLEKVPPVLDWTDETRHALNQAIADGDQDYVRLLLSKHRLPPMADNQNVPLIADAIANGNDALFEMLLAAGADPNTILPSPCNAKFCEKLPAKFIRDYLEQDKGVTLLMLAAALGNEDYVQALLEAGADRNRMTAKEKMLALYFAAHADSWRCMQTLLGTGPEPEKLRVEIDLVAQRATVIKEGVTIFTTQCSTGRKGFATPAGQYVITDKDLSHRSTIYKVPMPYFMRLNCRDFGMHEGVTSSHYASHGCIRLPSSAARKLFTELPVGTVVRIN